MKKKIKFIVAALLLMVMGTQMTATAADDVNMPFYSYTYEETYTEAVAVPAPYMVEKSIGGADLGIGAFNSISDVFYDESGEKLYLTDSGNHRIVILKKDYTVERILDIFQNNGQADNFKNPSAVYIKNGLLYVSDTDHQRILAFDKTSLELKKVINQPEIKLLGEYTFLPKSFAVDLAGRIYVIAQNINEGIVQLNQDGVFERFVGAPKVTLTMADRMWRMIMTEKQREGLDKAVPTEYNAICLDNDGFLYLTTQDSTIPPISKLNCQGNNVLNVSTDVSPSGDNTYYTGVGSSKVSSFVDIAVRSDGIYAALDSSKGRIFVYDQEGVLLYCFGANGSQKGTIQSGSAIEIFGENILVTDRQGGSLTVYTETKFGNTVDKAVTLMLEGKYTESEEYWNEVLKQCPNYDYAYLSMARTRIQEKDYDEALAMLKGTSGYSYYTKAFEGMRKSVIADNFALIFIGIFVLILAFIVFQKLWKRYRVSERLGEFPIVQELRFSNHVMFHPFDGFWDLKHEKRGSLRAANVLTVLFILVYGLRAQWSGYIFCKALPEDINVIFEVATMVLPLALWIVANWCFTSLMSGEGTMKDIYIATAYALKPYIITAIPMLILSHFLSGNEAFIYNTIEGIIMVWMLGLIFFGMIVTHDYSLSKGILVAILTLVGICLILFLALLCINIVQDISSFANDIYQEIIYRMY